MKRILCAVCAVVLLLLASCGGTPDTETETNSAKQTYSLTFGQVALTFGADAEESIAALGEPLSKDASPSCGGVAGDDVLYTYPHFQIKTTPSASGNVIVQINLTDDTETTPEGVRVGDGEARLSLLGDAASDTGTQTAPRTLSYARGNAKLFVRVNGGSVAQIWYQIAE